MSKLLWVKYEVGYRQGSFKKKKKIHFFYHNDCSQGCLQKSINREKKNSIPKQEKKLRKKQFKNKKKHLIQSSFDFKKLKPSKQVQPKLNQLSKIKV